MNRKTNVIQIGKIALGGDNPVVVQSMTNTDTRNTTATIQQIKQLEAASCEIVRVAVPDYEAAQALPTIIKKINIPLIADIHFDYRLALASVKAGVDGLRINPGNIGEKWKVREVIRACKEQDIPIRIGVNAGSLDPSSWRKYGEVCAEALVDSALENIKPLEDMDFKKIKLSLKASSVMMTVKAYRLIAPQTPYPLHLGITEAGTRDRALIKSALGLGMLLHDGIGDTIRVSITGEPVDEVWAAYELLRNLNLRKKGVELISCPTCGRCEIDLIRLANLIDQKVKHLDLPIKIAVMGCVVNGPGEAREADIGIAGGKGFGLLFRKGEIIRKVPEGELFTALLKEIESQG